MRHKSMQIYQAQPRTPLGSAAQSQQGFSKEGTSCTQLVSRAQAGCRHARQASGAHRVDHETLHVALLAGVYLLPEMESVPSHSALSPSDVAGRLAKYALASHTISLYTGSST